MSTQFIEEFANPRNIVFNDNETKAETIAKLTHLYFNGKKVKEIGDLHVCRKSLRVLYLHNNAIRTTSTLNRLSSLTHLYLQNNCIDEISGLERLPNLRKLYLGMNRIKVFNNLRNMPQLRELHIERQLLKANEEFTFDVDCVAELGENVELLNITGLKLTTLSGLTQLYSLTELLASDNAFKCPIELGKSLAKLPHLQVLDLRGCPAQHNIYYKEHILGRAHHIQTIDGNEIPRHTRYCLRNLAMIKSRRSSSNNNNQDDKRPKTMQTRKSTSTAKIANKKCGEIVLNRLEEVCHQPWSALSLNCRTPIRNRTSQLKTGSRSAQIIRTCLSNESLSERIPLYEK